MSETIDELTIHYEEDGIEIVREEAKHVLSKGSWTTIMFLYRDWDRRKEAYSDLKATIRRYQKRNNRFQQQSKFNISSAKQARQISDVLNEWFAEDDSNASSK